MVQEPQESVRALRAAYARVFAALPWLDVSVWEDDRPAFPDYARASKLPGVTSAVVRLEMAGRIAELRGEGAFDILRLDPRVSGTLETLSPLFPEMAATRTPVVLLHTDVTVERIDAFAAHWPQLSIIVESGPLKLLYHFAELQSLLTRRPNVYLSTYNLCNWMGIERLCAAGLGGRLLFGSHSPRYSTDAAAGPIALAHLLWERKCDLAGNNLRRMLGRPVVRPVEVAVPEIAPFIIDAHAHSDAPGRFPVPDDAFAPEDWVAFMDRCAIERLCITPFESLLDSSADPGALTRALRQAAPGRVAFFEVFDPRVGATNLRRIKESLGCRDCVGIKIHPSFHETEADDNAYEPVYDLAERRRVPILTHSWDISETNPVQYMSHPDRFRPHPRRHPGVRLILGHAGGRPGALDAVVGLCREFAGVSVDLAGDYYDNGLIECLVDRIGVSRVIFGSDMNWMDPRCNMAPVLAADISDKDALAVLRGNAETVYARP